jgi:hypothetical protein
MTKKNTLLGVSLVAFLVGFIALSPSVHAVKAKSQTIQPDSEYFFGNTYKKDLATYKARLSKLAPAEKKILTTYASVTGTNYTDDLTMYNTLIDLMPRVNRFITSIESIQPKNEKIFKTHKIYIDAWNLQYQGFTVVISALENQDYAQMSRANRLLSQGRSKMTEFTREIKKL